MTRRSQLQFVNAAERNEDVEEGDFDSYMEQFASDTEEDIETDFATNAKSSQLSRSEQFKSKEENDALIDNYLQYQPEEIREYMNKLDSPIYRPTR